MSREIKFRVWDKKHKSYCSNVGFIGLDCGGNLCDIQSFCKGDGLENFVVQQFTGLLDKNGVEIYEGDIVIIKNSGILYEGLPKEDKVYLEVKFGNINFSKLPGFHFNPINYKAHANCGYTTPEKEEILVVGNIFQNPELLLK